MSPPTDAPTLAAPTPAAALDPDRRANAILPTKKVPLGEELPVFCEKCGYSLHGLRQNTCDHCTIRQFHCPECGHHQPINTLRPAFQKILGRARAFFVAGSVLFKLNFFGWLFFAWFAMGSAWSYRYDYDARFRSPTIASTPRPGAPRVNGGRVARDYALRPAEVDMEQMFAFSLFALAFGMFGRMFLLRWRRGYLVGLSLSAIACFMIALGAFFRQNVFAFETIPEHPYTADFMTKLGTTAVSMTLGASIVWGVWTALATVFLPKRTSRALLDWQSAQSNPAAASLARD